MYAAGEGETSDYNHTASSGFWSGHTGGRDPATPGSFDEESELIDEEDDDDSSDSHQESIDSKDPDELDEEAISSLVNQSNTLLDQLEQVRWIKNEPGAEERVGRPLAKLSRAATTSRHVKHRLDFERVIAA